MSKFNTLVAIFSSDMPAGPVGGSWFRLFNEKTRLKMKLRNELLVCTVSLFYQCIYSANGNSIFNSISHYIISLTTRGQCTCLLYCLIVYQRSTLETCNVYSRASSLVINLFLCILYVFIFTHKLFQYHYRYCLHTQAGWCETSGPGSADGRIWRIDTFSCRSSFPETV